MVRRRRRELLRLPPGYKQVTCPCRQETAILYHADPAVDPTFYCMNGACLLMGKTGKTFLPLTPEQHQAVYDIVSDQSGGPSVTITFKPVPNSEKVELVSIKRVPQETNTDNEDAAVVELAKPECESEIQLEQEDQVPNTSAAKEKK